MTKMVRPCLINLNEPMGIKSGGRSANLIVARSSDCNKAKYRAATTRQYQNNGSLANGEAFIQQAHDFCSALTGCQ